MRFQRGFTLSEALQVCGALLAPASPPNDLSRRFQSLDSPECAGADSLVVLGAGLRRSETESFRASMVLAEEGVTGMSPSIPVMRVVSARQALAALLTAFAARIQRESPFVSGGGNAVHKTAVVEGILEGDVTVGAGAYVGPGCFIGKGSCIEPRAVIQANVCVGRKAVIQSGAVVGCAGFGFFDGPQELEPMPHLAGVEIGDRCFVGANAVIAAGVLHPTQLGDDCKLDSHVQIAHNVRLGQSCLLASQSGIAGSTHVGDGFRMGGAASVAGHLRIGNSVSVAACSGVTKDLPDGAVVAGFPARPIRAWRRREALLRRMEQTGRREFESDFI